MRVGKSNATEGPVCPRSSRNLYRRLVSSAVPNPENCRIVHSRPRYIVGWMPRGNGQIPGRSAGAPRGPLELEGVAPRPPPPPGARGELGVPPERQPAVRRPPRLELGAQ